MDVNNPFKIEEEFHNYQLTQCYFSIIIKNNTIYPLTIYNSNLTPKLKQAHSSKISDLLLTNINNQEIINKIKLVQSLEEIKNNELIPLDKSLENIS